MSSRLKRVSFKKLLPVVVLSALLSSSLTSASYAAPDQGSGRDSVLQTVNVAVGADGAIHSVADDRLYVDTEGDSNVGARHESDTYRPRSVAQQLPVRILTSYSTPNRQGTHLSDLAGYTGRVTINISVQNLTVEPKQISYEVAGQEKARTGLVGAPLTVVSSVALDVPASSVVTADAKGRPSGTNGVLSADSNGNARVQWASILAPPQLPSVTNMRLVADVKSFAVPDVAISVQPGYVSDASVPSLLRRSFQDQSRSEAKTIADTIQVLADVDSSLAKTGKTIGETRDALSVSASTIGARTITDLQQSISSIESSTSSVIGALDSVNSQLSSSLDETNSVVAGELSTTVNSMKALLGNTQASAPSVTVDEDKCEARVDAPAGDKSVYGAIRQIDGLLKGYALASASCQVRVQRQLVDALGPKDPTLPKACDGQSGLTCNLERTQSEIQSSLQALQTASGNAAKALDLEPIDDAAGTVKSLSDDLTKLRHALPAVARDDAKPAQLKAIEQDFGSIKNDLDYLLTHGIPQLHQQAQIGAATSRAAERTRRALETKICGMVESSTQSNSQNPGVPQPVEKGLSTDEAGELLGYVSSSDPTSDGVCDTAPSPIAATPQNDGPDLQTYISEEQRKWDELFKTTTEPSNAEITSGGNTSNFYLEVTNLKGAIDSLQGLVKKRQDADDKDALPYRTFVKELRDRMDAKILPGAKKLRDQVKYIHDSRSKVESNLQGIFDATQKDLGNKVSDSFEKGYEQVNNSAVQSFDSLDKTFTSLIVGMLESGDALTSSSRQAINTTNAAVDKNAKAMASATTERVAQNLQQINGTVSAATRDVGATNTLLSQDIAKVLADLGTNSVKGSGLLGTLAASTASVESVNGQLAGVSENTASFANSQRSDLEDSIVVAAQIRANTKRSKELGPFATAVEPGTSYTTVYNFTLEGTK